MNGHGLGAMETTNAIFDEKLYKECTPDTVPSFIVVLCLLSHAALAGEQRAGARPEAVGGALRQVQQRHLQQPGGRAARERRSGWRWT